MATSSRSKATGAVPCCGRICQKRCAPARRSCRCIGRRRSRAPGASMRRSIRPSIRSRASPSSSILQSKFSAFAVRWHGTILARRAVMLPQIAYWTRIKGSGHYAYVVAGDQPIAAARQALSAALRATNPGPWIDGEASLGAVIADGRLEAVMALGETRDEGARDRLAPFMAIERLSVDERNALLQGGDSADRGGEMCACFGVSCTAVEARHCRTAPPPSMPWARRPRPAPTAAPAGPRSASCCALPG